jgi:hypothetical protein
LPPDKEETNIQIAGSVVSLRLIEISPGAFNYLNPANAQSQTASSTRRNSIPYLVFVCVCRSVTEDGSQDKKMPPA